MKLTLEILNALAEYQCVSSNSCLITEDLKHSCDSLYAKTNLCSDDIKHLINDAITGNKCNYFVIRLLDLAWKDLLIPEN